MAITVLTDLLDFTEGSELITGGDFTGDNGDPVNAWFDTNGGNTGNNQEIQSNKCELSNPNNSGSSYIGRASLAKNYLGADGAQVPIVAQFDFGINANPTTASSWGVQLQLWESTDDFAEVALGHYDGVTAPGDWDTYGYGTLTKVDGTFLDPNIYSGIINATDTSGKLRLELVPYTNRDSTWAVEARCFYWNGSSWVIINKNGALTGWPNSLGNTGLYLAMANQVGAATITPSTVDNASAKEITDHGWEKDTDRIGNGFHFDYVNSKIVCENQGGGSLPHFYYDDLYTNNKEYTTIIEIEDYVSGECKVYHGNTLLATLTANGRYAIRGACDADGANAYDELWLSSAEATNSFSVTELKTVPSSVLFGVDNWSKVLGVESNDVLSFNGVY